MDLDIDKNKKIAVNLNDTSLLSISEAKVIHKNFLIGVPKDEINDLNH